MKPVRMVPGIPVLVGLWLLLGGGTYGETLPGFRFKWYAAPAPDHAATCTDRANGNAVIERVQLAQTHLMETSDPFYYLSAERATLIRVQVTGSGAAPAIQVEAWVKGTRQGRICLSGPPLLPTASAQEVPHLSTSYVGTLPASWMHPGLALTIRAGQSVRKLKAEDLKVGPAPVLTLVTMDWLMFGNSTPIPLPVNFGSEYASRLPTTAIQHSAFPLQISISQLPIGPRAKGRDARGFVKAMPAVIATDIPHCSFLDRVLANCTPWDGEDVFDAVLSMTHAIQLANGMDYFSYWYSGVNVVPDSISGLGDTTVGVGEDYALTLIHEQGHAFGMPHWGHSLDSGENYDPAMIYPYTGQFLNDSNHPLGGGYGNTWAYDPVIPSNPFISPICPAGPFAGKERQDPLQQYDSDMCLSNGENYAYFSDYSAFLAYRHFVGSSKPYRGYAASPRDHYGDHFPVFSMPMAVGRTNMVLQSSGDPKLLLWNETAKSYVHVTPSNYSPTESRNYGEVFPLQWNVPVYTLWGSFSLTTSTATTIQPPLKYVGNLKRLWDPTNATDFAELKTFGSADGFWSGADLVARADFSDGSYRHVLIKGLRRRPDPLDADASFMYWAINIPAQKGKTLSRVSLYYRPMDIRSGDGGRPTSPYWSSTNLNSTLNADLSADHYLDSARLVAIRSFRGI